MTLIQPRLHPFLWVVWRSIICNILFPHYPNIEDKKQRVLLRLKGFLVNLKHDTRHNCWYFFEAEAYCLIYMAKVPSVSRLIHSITINNIRSKRRPNRALLKENIRQNMCSSIIIEMKSHPINILLKFASGQTIPRSLGNTKKTAIQFSLLPLYQYQIALTPTPNPQESTTKYIDVLSFYMCAP